MCCSVLQCVAMCCSVLQCVAGCCSMLQCVVLWILTCMSHVVLVNQTSHTREPVISHVWMRHVTREWVIAQAGQLLPHDCGNNVTRVNESCHAYGWVMLHVNESYHRQGNYCRTTRSLQQSTGCTRSFLVPGLRHVCAWVVYVYESCHEYEM